MSIVNSSLSCWQAARIAVARILRAMDDGTRGIEWIGVDASGDVVAGIGDASCASVLVVPAERMQEMHELLLLPILAMGSDRARGCVEEIDAVSLLVQEFEQVAAATGPDVYLWEPAVSVTLPFGAGASERAGVGFAALSSRDRIEAHVALGCRHCRRPRYAFPEDPSRWDAVEAWRRRWELTGLSASEAALWTVLVGCRPEVATELRASGLTAERLQGCVGEWMGDDPMSDPADLADRFLDWVRSGFSWAKLEEGKVWLGAAEELLIDRELRSRGVEREAAYREIEVEGRRVELWDFLYDSVAGERGSSGVEERLAWLEQAGEIPAWGAGLE